ncbi:Thiolase, N-terminal domain-containing protein [Umbelopsis sp. PMI_123]|nr:Thiolase, N-terminal domain-containing protein [Umbelopsis sp. PMI_123]
MASTRLQQIQTHLAPNPSAQKTKVGVKSPEDVVVVSALRTAITKGRKGGFKDMLPEEILSAVLKATLEKTKLDPKLVDDICVGNVAAPGGLATASRMAALHAGFPETTSLNTTNRQCSSGLQACVQIATAIQSGLIEIGIGAGVESMTQNYFSRKITTSKKIAEESQSAADCLIPMGITSENVAAEWNISRLTQDEFSALSHTKAIAAQKAGLFKDEIVPVTATIVDKDGNERTIVVDKDEGMREGTSTQVLAKLKPAFKADGSTTAGNASQVSDGAAAVLLMKRKTAQKLGLPVLGKYVTSAVVGVPPKVMGIGPAFAIPVAVERAGLKVDDVDIFELNEAFASQAVYTVQKCNIPIEKVNPKGGAIALGHPLGCTGARQVATLFPELKRQNKKIGCTTMCIGSGMGMAAIWERE